MALANDASQQILPGVDGTRGIERFDLLGISVCKVSFDYRSSKSTAVPSYLKSGRRHVISLERKTESP